MLRKIWADISYAGVHNENERFAIKQQILFNQLNFLAIAGWIFRMAFIAITGSLPFSMFSFLLCLLPIAICSITGILAAFGKYGQAKNIAFLLFPPAIGLMAMQQNDYGLSVFPLLFCILAFFFLEEKKSTLAAFLNGAGWFVTLRISELAHSGSHEFFTGLPLLVFNHILVLSFIYLLLNFIKQLVKSYQQKLAMRSHELAATNKGLLVYQEEILQKTTQLENRQQLLENAVRQKNKMLSIISHDLRTPIQSVRNLLDLHEKKIMPDEALVNYVPELNREMGQVSDLLENLLAWSKQQQDSHGLKKERTALQPLVLEICALYEFYAKGKSVQLVAEVPDGLELTGNRQMVKTVLRNLVSNAIKFSHPGGRVTIGATAVNHEARITITDNGMGISPANIFRIVNGEEFTTRGSGGEYGSGLGLALCREFIQKNGGRLNINSTPAVGSAFSFTWPLNIPGSIAPESDVLKPRPFWNMPAVSEP